MLASAWVSRSTKKTITALTLVAGLGSFSQSATAAIVTNPSPGYNRSGNVFETYSVLPNASPNGGGFYLIMDNWRPAQFMNMGEGMVYEIPSQPATARLSSFSDSHFSVAPFGQAVNSSLISPSQTGLDLSNGNYYVAFDVVDQLNSDAVYYGWLDVTVAGVDSEGSPTFTLNAWAYDDTGASINVGQFSAVPEPSGNLALLGLCSIGLLARRRLARKA
jgi:hypothetical protein